MSESVVEEEEEASSSVAKELLVGNVLPGRGSEGRGPDEILLTVSRASLLAGGGTCATPSRRRGLRASREEDLPVGRASIHG